MKKILTILLLLVSLVSFSQEYYRDTTIERAVFNEVNRHRDSMGLHTVRFNPDNRRAIEWGEVLVKHDLSTDKYHCSCCRGVLYHCNCAPGVEIIALRVIGDENEITMSVEETAKKLVKGWDGSPSHKKGMLKKDVTRVAISLVPIYWESDISYTYKGEVITHKLSGVRYCAALLVIR